ncbi:MAG: trypsin-like peptidase domain-containing protein [Bdellovibrionales bacterium]|nr:trypsin-like peptidase domain-containing protein [Oligoflexia bacterium]
MKVKLVVLAVLSFTVMACGSQQSPTVEALSNSEEASLVEQAPLNLGPVDAHPSKIIGSSSLLSVKVDGSNVDANLRPYLNAFGIISIEGKGICSGTHIGNGLVITAGHCFFDEKPGNMTSTNAACPNIKVYWGYRGSPANGNPKPVVSAKSQCTKLIYAERSNEKDFAIFKVDQAPNVSIPISTDTQKTPTGTKLTVFGYPQGRPLEWSQYCPLSGTAGSSFGFTGSATFIYQCDTEPGNSGSSVLAVTSTGVVKVIGVHDGAAPSGVDYNYATYMIDVRSTLAKKGFNLDRASK